MRKEDIIRDYIADNMGKFIEFIVNFSEFKDELKSQKTKFLNIDISESNGPSAKELINQLIVENMTYATDALDEIQLIKTEFPLLDSGKRGKKPSIDILSFDKTNKTLLLNEIKISNVSEREAVTELSAYSQGLQNRFRGLSFFDFLWIPISTEWRITTKSAIEFQMVWNNIQCLPLHMEYKIDENHRISNLTLNCFNPISEIPEEKFKTLFSYNSFETFDFYTTEPIKDPDTLTHFISSLCSKYNISGFAFNHKPNNYYPYPYGMTVCILNPYKAYLLSRLLLLKKEGNNDLEDFSQLELDTDFMDIDFLTDEMRFFTPSSEQMEGTTLKYDEYWEKGFLSVGSFLEKTENRKLSFLINEIKSQLNLMVDNKFVFGLPSFKGVLRKIDDEKSVKKVIYYGFFEDIIKQRIKYDFSKKRRKICNINEPLTAFTDYCYFRQFMKIMNYEDLTN